MLIRCNRYGQILTSKSKISAAISPKGVTLFEHVKIFIKYRKSNSSKFSDCGAYIFLKTSDNIFACTLIILKMISKTHLKMLNFVLHLHNLKQWEILRVIKSDYPLEIKVDLPIPLWKH